MRRFIYKSAPQISFDIQDTYLIYLLQTDALRRHQKSRCVRSFTLPPSKHLYLPSARHNGVVIEPADPSRGAKWGDKTQKAESSSATQSRSGTPNKDVKACSDPNADAMVITVPVPTVLVRPDTAGPGSGPQSYYRQHTVNPGSLSHLFLRLSLTLFSSICSSPHSSWRFRLIKFPARHTIAYISDSDAECSMATSSPMGV